MPPQMESALGKCSLVLPVPCQVRVQPPEAWPGPRAMLEDLRDHADFLRPFELLQRVLVRHDGRRALGARLGAEAEDGVDALLQAVRLAGLADDERVDTLTCGGRGVEHRRGDRVGAERQATDGDVVEVGRQVAHDATDERRGLAGE